MMPAFATRWTSGEKVLLGLSGLLLASGCCMQLYAAAGGDQPWLLMAARMWLDGGRLYSDIFEVNPPLIIWLYALPVFLAHHLHVIAPAHALALIAFGAIALCLWVSDRLAAFHPQADSRRRVMFALLLALLYVPFVNPLHFADREHLFTIFAFPYVLRFAPAFARMKLPPRLSAVIGVMAGVGFCIKPHCAIIFAGVQLITLLRERRAFILVSRENLLIYLLSAAYLLSIGLLAPDYYTTVLPMALETYGGFNRKEDWIFYAAVSFLILGATFVDFRPGYRTPYRADVYYFLALVPFFYAYALINNGWAYTYVPLKFLLILLSGLVLADQRALYREQGVKSALHCVRACALVLVTRALITVVVYAAALYANFDGNDYESETDKGLAAAVRDAHANTFGALSINFGMWPPLADATGAKLVTRFNHLWMLPRFLVSGPDFTLRHSWVIAYIAHAFAADLRRHRPDIVFVDVNAYLPSNDKRLDVPALLLAYPDFREEWGHYRRGGGIDACHPPARPSAKKSQPPSCRFDFYRRAD